MSKPEKTPAEVEQDLRRVVLEMAEALGSDPDVVGKPLDEVAGLLVGSMGDWTLDHKLYHMSCCYALALRMLHEGLLTSVQNLNTPPPKKGKP